MVLPDATLDNFLTDQKAKHDLQKELIDSGVIILTTNTAAGDNQIPAAHAEFPVFR